MAGTPMEFDENTTDPVTLAAMFESMDKGAPETPQADPAAAPEPAKVEPAVEEQANAAAVEKEPDGVATKDGKHIIPYSVLKADRDRATRAEEALRAAQDQLAALQQNAGQGVKEGNPATPHQEANASGMSDEDMAALKEDFPTVYKGLMAMQAQAASLQSQLKPVQDSVSSAEQIQRLTVAEQVQDAIDSTPKLAHIMASDQAAYELAKQFDNTLKANSAWADKPLSERFAKVIEMVELAHGAITVPGQAMPQPAQKSAEQLKQEAKAVAAASAQAGKTTVPTSLSDFPAGQHAASDEREAVENMTPLQIAQKFASMSPDKLEAYLQNF